MMPTKIYVRMNYGEDVAEITKIVENGKEEETTGFINPEDYDGEAVGFHYVYLGDKYKIKDFLYVLGTIVDDIVFEITTEYVAPNMN